MEKWYFKTLCGLISSLLGGIFVFSMLNTELKLGLAIVTSLLILFLFLLLANFRKDITLSITKLSFLTRITFSLLYFISLIAIVVIPSIDSQVMTWDQIPLINYLRLLSSLLITFILPGITAIKLICRENSLSVLEYLLFSFLVSIFITFISGINFVFLIIVNLGFLLFSFYITIEEKEITPIFSRAISTNILEAGALLCTFLLFLLSVTSMFSGFWLFLGPDFWRHYGWVLNLMKGIPEIPLFPRCFHILYMAFFQLSGFPYINAYIFSLPFAFMTVISFYLMASAYLRDVDKQTPLLSTIIWTFFSGFGWIYVTYQKLTTSSDYLKILDLVQSQTLLDIGYPPGFWHILGDNMPAAIGATALFSLLYLVRKTEFKKNLQCFLFTIIFVTGFAIHSSETVFFFTIIPILLILKKRISIKNMLFLIFLGCLMVIALDFTYQITQIGIFFPSTFFRSALLILFSSLIGYLLTYLHIKLHTLHFPIKFHFKKTLTAAISILLIYLFGLSILTWLEIKDEFNWWYTAPSRFVPWYFYPLRLGTAGLLMLFVITYWRNLQKNFKDVFTFLVCSLLFTFSFGRIISYININYFDCFFQEVRMIAFLFIPLAMLTSMSITSFFRKLTLPTNLHLKLQKRFLRSVVSGLILTIIITSGMLSTLITVEYWTLHSKDNLNKVSFDEFPAMQYLRHNTDLVPISKNIADYEFVSTPTELSYRTLNAFSGTGTYLPHVYKGRILFDAKRPEQPLHLLSSYKTKYIYLAQRDYEYLRNRPDSFVASYLLKNLHTSFKDNIATIYEVPPLSPPLPDSEMAIIFPSSSIYSTSMYDALFMFALSQYNYTTVLDYDSNLFSKRILILPCDPLNVQAFADDDFLSELIRWVERGGHLIVMNSDGFGRFSALLKIQVLDDSFIADKIIGNTNKLSIPEVKVNTLIFSDSTVEVLANYSKTEEVNSPYVLRKTVGHGVVTYVYAEPYISLLRNLEDNNSQRVWMFNNLRSLLRIIDLQLPQYKEDNVKKCSVTIREVSILGSIELLSSWVIFPKYVDLLQKNIRAYSDVEWVIHANDLEIKPSDSGLYSRILVKGDFELILNVNNTSTALSERTEQPIEFLARTPEFHINGKVILKTVYIDEAIAYDYWGSEVIVDGPCVFTIEYADTFMLVSGFQANNKLQIAGWNVWDEWGAVPWTKVIMSLEHLCFVSALAICFIFRLFKR